MELFVWPVLPIAFWVIAILSVVLVGVSKAGFGGGAGVIATPLMAMVLPVSEAAAILLPLLIVADLSSYYLYRKSIDFSIIRTLLPPALIGIFFGGLLFSLLVEQERIFKVAMGILAIGFVVYDMSKHVIFLSLEDRPPGKVWGAVLGAVTGFTSTLAHIGGPPAMVYILPQKLPRQIFVGTTVFVFTTINLVKLIPYSLLGLLNVGNISLTLLLLPFVFVGVRLGMWLNGRLSQQLFLRVVYVILFLTGIQLIAGISILTVMF